MPTPAKPLIHVQLRRGDEDPATAGATNAAIDGALARRLAAHPCAVCTATCWRAVDPPTYGDGAAPRMEDIFMLACGNCGAMLPFARQLLVAYVARGGK